MKHRTLRREDVLYESRLNIHVYGAVLMGVIEGLAADSEAMVVVEVVEAEEADAEEDDMEDETEADMEDDVDDAEEEEDIMDDEPAVPPVAKKTPLPKGFVLKVSGGNVQSN